MPNDDADHARRRFLTAAGSAAALGALAGCGGGGGDGTTTTPSGDDATTTATTTDGGGGDDTTTTETTTSQGEPLDAKFTNRLGFLNATKVHFNPWNGKQNYGVGIHHDNLAVYDRPNKEWLPRIASEWDIADDSVVVTVDDSYSWTQWTESGPEERGPVTAEDVRLHYELNRLMDLTDGEFEPTAIASWEVKDDQTIELMRTEESQQLNRIIFEHQVLPTSPKAPRFKWADHVESLRGMEPGSEEFNSYLGENVTNYRSGPAEIFANGPYIYEKTRAKREIVFEKNPYYPRADQIEVPKYNEINIGEGEESRVLALRNDEVDYIPNADISPQVAKTFPDHVQKVVTGGLGGGATYFDHDARWTGKSDFRQAIVSAVDNGQVVRNISRTPVGPRICGISNQSMKSNWIGDVLPDFTSYEGKQQERASELARSVGLEKNSNGWWAEPNGDPVEIEFKAISGWTGAIVMNQTIVSHLRGWGLKAESVGIPTSTFFSKHWTKPEDMKPFDAIKYPVFGSPYVWHPYYYENYFFREGGPGSRAKTAHTYEVPATVGDPDSAVETVDAQAMATELGQTPDLDRQKEIVERLSWLYNQNAVAFINNKPATHGWYTYDEWDLPEVDTARDPPEVFESFGNMELFAQGVITPEYESG